MKIENLDRFKRKLAKLPQAVKDDMRGALKVSAEEIADLMRRSAPVESGDLQRSIGFTFGKYVADNANVRGVTAGGGSHDLSVTIHAGDERAYYAAFVEFGTAPHTVGGKFKGAHHPGSYPRPFFFPSWRIGKKRAKSRVTRATTKAAKRVAAGG